MAAAGYFVSRWKGGLGRRRKMFGQSHRLPGSPAAYLALFRRLEARLAENKACRRDRGSEVRRTLPPGPAFPSRRPSLRHESVEFAYRPLGTGSPSAMTRGFLDTSRLIKWNPCSRRCAPIRGMAGATMSCCCCWRVLDCGRPRSSAFSSNTSTGGRASFSCAARVSATIAGYRDTFPLLLRFASEQRNRPPTKLGIDDLDADLIGDFLLHVETARGKGARSRNTRLAAIRSFFHYVAMNEPAWLLHCQRILTMPSKRYVKQSVSFPDASEIAALLSAPDRSTWAGRRDHVILLVALRTGLRASELTNLRSKDVVLGTGAHVTCKGRKERRTSLRRDTIGVLRTWLKERRGDPHQPLFPSMRGTKLSRDALEHLVSKHNLTADRSCPGLAGKRVSPPTLRHSNAMELLQNGVDQSVIALWLGHESVETTQVYLHTDLRMKEKALSRVTAPQAKPGRYRPDDKPFAFLEAL